jgi:hypothetical protein
LLGEADPLDYAVGQHDPSVSWGMIRCTIEVKNRNCPEDKEINIGFEAALTELLTEAGYLEARD